MLHLYAAESIPLEPELGNTSGGKEMHAKTFLTPIYRFTLNCFIPIRLAYIMEH